MKRDKDEGLPTILTEHKLNIKKGNLISLMI